MSPLFSRIVREHRATVLPLAIGVLANVLLYLFVVSPRGAKAAGAADRAAAAANAVRTAEREQKAAEALVSGKARADQALTAFYKDVLPSSREEARRMMDVTLPSLADDTNVRWLKRTSEIPPESDQDARFGQLIVSMVLQGEYSDLRDFIYALESAPQFIVVDDVVLTESESDEPLTLSVRMSTYFRKTNGV